MFCLSKISGGKGNEVDRRPYLKQPQTFLSRMNQCRGGGAGAHHPQLGFLVSGGGRFSVYSTTEISKDGRTFSTFTPLGNATGPTKRCCVALDGDDGEFFLAGGTGWGYVSSTAFIHRRGQWDEVEPIPTARYCKKSILLKQV